MGEISFNSSEKEWVMKINNDGIFFNRELFKNVPPDGFATAVIEILEKNYAVKFKKKKKAE